MKNNKIIENIGVEFEYEDLQQERFNVAYFEQKHDASCESPAYSYEGFGDIILREEIENKKREKVTIGGELVSNILTDSDDILSILKNLTDSVYLRGESERGYRSSIHIHVAMSYNLNILKNLMRLGLNLESAFFHLGGMGYDFRGIFNDSIYCRPISKYGPPIVKYCNGNYGPVFDAKDCLEANSSEQFWERYGSLGNPQENKYNPVRYVWLSLFPLLTKGTVEFRIFNKTLNPFYIYSIIVLCQRFCEASLGNLESFSLEENSIFKTSKFESSAALQNIFGILKLPIKVEKTLMKIIGRTPEIKIPEKYVFSHLIDKKLFFPTSYSPKPVDRSEVIYPTYVDLHRLEG